MKSQARVLFVVMLFLLGLLLLVLRPQKPSLSSPPNIVLILADDLGCGDLAVYGHPYAEAPAIDSLAAQGTLFRRFYASGAVCVPSRTGFMTGRFAAGLQADPKHHGFSDALTITDLLSNAGYRTGHFGKWSIGPRPTETGTYGMDVIGIRGGNRRDPRGRDARIFDAAIEFIRESTEQPFYVNIWPHATHSPIRPLPEKAAAFRDLCVNPADFDNPDQQAYFAAYKAAGGDLNAGMRHFLSDVKQLDDQVQRVLDVLDQLGLADSTLVVFTSDNGPALFGSAQEFSANMVGSAGPLRGRKHELYEGGIRMPFIIRWPGRVAAGHVNERSIIAAVDWMPTLGQLAGTPLDAALHDGEDVSEIWLGQATTRERDLFWRRPSSGDTAMVRGQWKAIQRENDMLELYDLSHDPSERNDVAADHPGVTQELGDTLSTWRASLPDWNGQRRP